MLELLVFNEMSLPFAEENEAGDGLGLRNSGFLMSTKKCNDSGKLMVANPIY